MHQHLAARGLSCRVIHHVLFSSGSDDVREARVDPVKPMATSPTDALRTSRLRPWLSRNGSRSRVRRDARSRLVWVERGQGADHGQVGAVAGQPERCLAGRPEHSVDGGQSAARRFLVANLTAVPDGVSVRRSSLRPTQTLRAVGRTGSQLRDPVITEAALALKVDDLH